MNANKPKPPDPCPVITDGRAAIDATHQATKAVRRFYRSMRSCDDCPNIDDCPEKQEILTAIHTAIAELTEERDLSSLIQRT